MSSRLKKSEVELKSQKTMIEELEAKVKESFEAQMQVTHNSKKDIAMRDQQIEFLTMQLKELKESLEESQRQHSSMVDALNRNNETSDDDGESKARLELLQKEFEATTATQLAQISDLTLENEQLSQKLSDVEHQHRLALTELQHKLSEAKMTHDDLEHNKSQLLEKIKHLESTKVRFAEESETQLAKVRQQQDKEMTEREELYQREKEYALEQSTQQISQMKNVYEMEKTQLETRLTEEKERAARRIQTVQDENESKIAEATREKDMELEYLQDQLNNFEQHQQNLQAQFEHELSLKQQTCDNITR